MPSDRARCCVKTQNPDVRRSDKCSGQPDTEACIRSPGANEMYTHRDCAQAFIIRHCDRIIMLEDGKIIEDGTYDELMKKNGQFAAMVERQQLDSTL